MPLPPALAARLAKRGLIPKQDKTSKESAKKESKKKVHEEVIAEDYDNSKEDLNPIDIFQKFMGYSGCPNKFNIYHDCTKRCKEIWGAGQLQPSEKYLKKQMKLIQKYPLPETWRAVYDPGCGQHYYWDWSSDLVSWLPPGHPKCQISQPASQLREELHLKDGDQDDNSVTDESGSDQEMETDDNETRKDRKDNRETRDGKDRDRNDSRDKHKMDNRKSRNSKDGRNKKESPLDPMDPASYSDIPRGKWSDGLARNNEAKTGADTTASGPLFQMRPYPSPNQVLRSNRASQKEPENFNKPNKVMYPEKPE